MDSGAVPDISTSSLNGDEKDTTGHKSSVLLGIITPKRVININAHDNYAAKERELNPTTWQQNDYIKL